MFILTKITSYICFLIFPLHEQIFYKLQVLRVKILQFFELLDLHINKIKIQYGNISLKPMNVSRQWRLIWLKSHLTTALF